MPSPFDSGRHPHPPLRLVGDEPEAFHPLTTLSAPLLPARDAVGARADVWEELDRAAAWVCDAGDHDGLGAPPGADAGVTAESTRHGLRVLCIALRAAAATPGPVTFRSGDLPWAVPVHEFLAALRRRLLAQFHDDVAAGRPSPEPAELLRVLDAMERVDTALRSDATRTVADQLRGGGALELLVEVAHDMRSPLGSILFLVERLRDDATDALSEMQRRQLGLVYGAAFGLSTMVSDVMELARGGDRLATGEPAPVSLVEIVEAVQAIVQPIAEEKRLALRIGDAPRDVRVGHGPALHRVLLNLVTNALKFTPEGHVSLRVEPRGPARVAFIVEDSGRGIPRRVLAHLFDTFRRRASAHDYAFSSAGLGLAICQKLIGAMGGELHVASEEGRGTRFTFELELPPAPALPASPATR